MNSSSNINSSSSSSTLFRMLFNGAVSFAEVIQCQMKQKENHISSAVMDLAA
jgi:flagellin-specific chaperone FliS